MPWITTEDAALLPVGSVERYQAYCMLDGCMTLEVDDSLTARMDPVAAGTYAFEMSQLSAAMEMWATGIAVDEGRAAEELERLEADEARCLSMLQTLAAVWLPPPEPILTATARNRIATTIRDQQMEYRKRNHRKRGPEREPEPDWKALRLSMTNAALESPRNLRQELLCNPLSPVQVAHLLYTQTGEAPYHVRKTKADGTPTYVVTVADDALTKLQRRNPIVGVMAALIVRCRELRKQLGYVRARRSPDGRLRSSFNVGATEVGRWSYSKDPFRDGLNFGNVPKDRRSMLVASPGYVMVNVDFKAAESHLVAYLANDPAYIEAHKRDVHAAVARRMGSFRAAFPDWPTPDTPEEDVFVRTTKVRGKALRQHAKSRQHGCLTEDHEVLTPTGWMLIQEARLSGAPIMVNAAGFEVPRDWYVTTLPPDASIISFRGKAYSQIVTETHKMPTNCGDVEAQNLHTSARLQRTLLWDGGSTPIPEVSARLMAAFAAEGRQCAGYVEFRLRSRKKLERLHLLAAAANLSCADRLNPDGTTTIELPLTFPAEGKAAGPYMLSWRRGAVAAYIDEQQYWGRHPASRVCHIFTHDAQHAEWLHTLAHLVGRGGRCSLWRPGGVYRRPLWRVTLNHRRWVRAEGIMISRLPGAGVTVLCPVTSTGRFLIRHRGEISVSGNTNYGLTPAGAADRDMIPLAQAKADMGEYFAAFPLVHARVSGMVSRLYRDKAVITTVLGRRRQFFGKLDDHHTFKEALQFEPCSICSDLLCRAMLRFMDLRRAACPSARLLNQTYDSLLLEVRAEELDAAKDCINAAFIDPISINGHTVQLRIDIGVGGNWKDAAA